MLENAKDVFYGRVAPYIPPHKTRKMKNAVFIVSFWLPYWKPGYAYADRWLSYEVQSGYYKIFNPQKFIFRNNELVSFIIAWHRKVDDVVATNFRVVVSDGGT